jgi:hypothetical protein
MRALRSFALSLAIALSVGDANAQAVDAQRAATAQALYDAAGELMDAGKYGEACPKLEEATRLEPSAVGAKLRLAQCYEGEHRFASAWTMYLAAEGAARAVGQHEREQRAHDRAAALDGRVSRLSIHVSAAVRALSGRSIERDGQPVGDGQLDVPIPLDGGAHEIRVKSPGKKVFSAKITLEEEGANKTLDVLALEDELAPAPSVSATPPAPPSAAIAAPPPRVESTVSPIPTWSWVLGGVALAAGAGAAAFGGDLLSATSHQRELCGDALDHCERTAGYDPDGDNARKHRDYALVLALSGASVAAAAGAVIGVVTSRGPRAPTKANGTRLSPWLAPTSVGLAGRF